MDSAALRDLLLSTRRIALVGASLDPARASYEVMGFLLGRGYDVVPVNPGYAGKRVHGQVIVGSLDEAVPFDLADLFRAPEHVLAPVRDAVRLGARAVWMQLGVVNEPAAEEARAAGLAVVMDRCPKIEWRRLGLPAHLGRAPGLKQKSGRTSLSSTQ